MTLSVLLTGNAGLCLCSGSTTLLIDGIHDGETVGFSAMHPALLDQARTRTGLFSNLSGLLFTHLHPDHFSRSKLSDLLSAPPSPVIYAPDPSISTAAETHLPFGIEQITIGSARIWAKPTVHSGKEYASVAHRSFLIQINGQLLFIPGDALLQPADADAFINYCTAPIQAAFFNVYQLLDPSSADFIRRLHPLRIFIYHLPFPADDRYHYYTLARHAAARRPGDLPPFELCTPPGWIDNRCPPGLTSSLLFS